jgi:hypothetical protein
MNEEKDTNPAQPPILTESDVRKLVWRTIVNGVAGFIAATFCLTTSVVGFFAIVILGFMLADADFRGIVGEQLIESTKPVDKEFSLGDKVKVTAGFLAGHVGTIDQYSSQNFPVKDWLGDLQQRVRFIGIAAEKKKLQTMETKLNSLTSEEQRRQLALAELEKELEE